jgi:hypothetical protein
MQMSAFRIRILGSKQRRAEKPGVDPKLGLQII